MRALAAVRAPLPSCGAPDGSRDVLGRGSDRICRLIDDVLELEDAGDSISGHPTDILLGPMMDQALGAAMKDAQDRGISFRARYDPALMLHVDPGVAIGVLRKIVDSAVKFHRPDDVAVDVEDRGTEVAIHVRDTSPGPPGGVNLIVSRRRLGTDGWTIDADCSLSLCCHVCVTLPASRA